METGEAQPIREIVIVGGGTAGWMTAAAAGRFLTTPQRRVRLIESEAIGTVGVGEGTIPPMSEFNQMLGIAEPDFMAATKATYKLGIDFVGWGAKDERYFHPFGHIGSSLDGVAFHQLWLKHRKNPSIGPLAAYSLSALAAFNNRFAPPAPPEPGSPVSPLSYAFHLDASLYATMLREFAEARGVERIEGRIVEVLRDGDSGQVTAVVLDDGRKVEGQL
ncbi:MAG: tryptophan 7-halogenase, partial [Sphingomicrobium sp.]